MVKKIRIKFICIASMAVIVIMTLIFMLITAAIFYRSDEQILTTLKFISEHDGEMPFIEDDKKYKGNINEETQYAVRYFTLFFDEDGHITEIHGEHIASVDEDEMEKMGRNVLDNRLDRGYVHENGYRYAYLRTKKDGVIQIVFMDCTEKFDTALITVQTSFWIAVASLLIFILIISVLSKKAIEPTIRNIENQKAFITNAGHELKTPLAVISANTEVLEMMNGKNEWTESIMNQVKRMSGLVNDFISLARMNERSDIVLTDQDFSEIALDVTSSFKPVILNQGKKAVYNITEGVIIKGDEKLLHELVNILVDNAAKYCDDEGTVSVSLDFKGKNSGAKLIVSNTYAEGKNVDYNRFFDRFYREDKSHNSKKQGYGIGLSMAESIVINHKGKIGVSYSDGEIHFKVII